MGNTEEARLKYDMDALIDWLNANWKDHTCPVCNGSDWKIQRQMFMTAESSSSIQSNGVGIYIIPISCEDCACMLLVNKRIVMEKMLSEGEQ